MRFMKFKYFGAILAIAGTIFSIVGAYVNNIWIDPLLARQLWMISNPILLVWAIGLWKNWWKDVLGIKCVVGLYVFFTVTNAMSLW